MAQVLREGVTDLQMDRQMDGQTDKPSYRGAPEKIFNRKGSDA